MKSSDPLEIVAQRFWPAVPEGEWDILAQCRQMDDAYNAGCGAPR